MIQFILLVIYGLAIWSSIALQRVDSTHLSQELEGSNGRTYGERLKREIDLAVARAQTGFAPEMVSKLEARDFDNVLDAGRAQDAASQFAKKSDLEVMRRPPASSATITDLHKRMGYNDVKVSRPMRYSEFYDHLNRDQAGGEFNVLYWPRGARGARVLRAKGSKNQDAKPEFSFTDSAGKTSSELPSDALWLWDVRTGQVSGDTAASTTDGGQQAAQASGAGGDQRGRVIGYATSWASKKFEPEQARMLTNAIYSFVLMDANGKLTMPDGKAHLQELFDARDAMKKEGKNLQVSFAIGGATNSQHFSSVLANPSIRSTLVNEVERTIKENNFDGVDLDWEYPAPGTDRDNYVTFVRELRERLGPGKLISIAAAPAENNMAGFDVAQLIKPVDWIGVMTYDYYGAWNGQVGPQAPLYASSPPEYSDKLNADWAMKEYACLSGGKDMDKLVMGLPFYGRYWSKTSPGKHDAEYPLYRAGEPLANGSFGGEATYRNLVEQWKINESPTWQEKWDDKSKTPWATDGSMVVSYDNDKSIAEKMKYAVDKNLGGAMIWAIDQDDSQNTLLRAVRDGAHNKLTGLKQSNYKCN